MNLETSQHVENPFASAPVVARPGGTEVATAAVAAREIAEVQGAMVMARRFPRNEMEVVDRILQACTRPTLAEGALYEYARGGTDIRGPSIRLAECIAQHWGHLDFGWRVLEERPGATKVQAFAWDMQSGARSQLVFDVTHERYTKQGRHQLHDPRDIYEHVANAASRRLRACILRVIPGDVVESAVKQCESTLRTKVEVTPERVQNLLAQFAELGVTKAQLEKRIQRRIEAITPGMMVQLGKIFTSLRDGMSQPGDWFELLDAPAGAPAGTGEAAGDPVAPNPRAAVRSRLQARKEAQQRAAAPATPPAQAPATVGPAPQQPEVEASAALVDLVKFCRAAITEEDLRRAQAIAVQIQDADEAQLGQQHLDAARRRIRG
jgi:hypothetical protein